MSASAAMIAAAVAVLALLGNIGVSAFYYGQLTQKVESHGKWLADLDSDVKDHEKRISREEGARAASA